MVSQLKESVNKLVEVYGIYVHDVFPKLLVPKDKVEEVNASLDEANALMKQVTELLMSVVQ